MIPPIASAEGPAAEAEIVVTGRGLPGSRGDVAYSVTTIDRAALEAAANERLEDVLRNVAGEQSFRRSDSRSSNATNQSITMRGMGGNASSRALLVLDGVPQADPFGGWTSFPAFSTDRLARIRVTRGGGSSLWGPGALAGTVEMESAGPGELPPASGALIAGSRRSIDARGSLVVGDSNAFASLGGAFMRGDGFVPIVAEDRGPIDERAPYRQFSAAARAGLSLGEEVELQANLSGFDDRRSRGQPNTANRGKGVDGSLRLVGRGPLDWSVLAYAQKREFATRSAAIDAARTTSTLANDQYDVPSTGLGGRAELIPMTGDTELRVGADIRRVKGETNELYQFVAGVPTRFRRAGGRSLTTGLFVDSTLTRGAFTGNVSARLDRWTIRDGSLFQRTVAGTTQTDIAYPDRSGWQPTGRVGIAYRTSDRLTLRSAAYRGWRLPTLNELYRPFRVGSDITAANAALKPEKSLGAEIGVEVALGERWKGSATLFASRLDNAIANATIAQGPGSFPEGFVPAGGNYRQRQNLDHIQSRGAELSIEGSSGRFDGRLAYAFVDAQVRADGAGAPLDGLRPAQVPRHFVAASLGWTGPRNVYANLTARGTSRQFEDDLNQRVLRGAVTLDGTLRIPIAARFAIEARAENIFDKRVEAARSSSDVVEEATPRTFWIGIALK